MHRSIAAFAALFAVACTSSHVPPEPSYDPPPSGASTEAVVGPGGATLSVEGIELVVPAGALGGDETIRITVTREHVPHGFRGFSPVLRFEPAGLRFERPARIGIPFGGDAELATIFWTRAGGGAYVALDTEVRDGVAYADVTHFSQAFVGSGCEGEGCCRRASSQLDVLMMVDNSNSMSEEQASLQAQLPRMARVLATGDLDGDGVQDFPAVGSLQMGVVTADMGTGGFTVPTCDEPNFGDDGILRTEGNTAIPGCGDTYPAIHQYRDGVDDPDAFAEDVGCVARMGTGGCGFEQQLEATLKAVAPSTMPMTFAMGTTGHGDGANAGLVRDGSILALIDVTDEDDCSSADSELHNPSSSEYSGNLNLRCFMYPDAVHPVDRYVDGFLALRDHPSQLVYAAIAGVPPGAITDAGAVDYDALLAHPDMRVEVDPSDPNRLRPSCDVPDRGLAFPPRRLVETARGLEIAGASAVVQSICQEDFTPALDAILGEVASRLSGVCD